MDSYIFLLTHNLVIDLFMGGKVHLRNPINAEM